MRSPRAFLLVAVLGGAGACHRSLDSPDAQTANKDADANSDAPGESTGDHPLACYPLFHACATTDECCAPNRCLNITGTAACQQEGPALDAGSADGGDPDSHATDASPLDGGDAASTRTQFTSWTSCGWSGGTCLCDGIRACQAVAGGSFSSLGSQQARVCAIDDGVCEFVVFVEIEGGGTARRCRVPIDAGSCLAGFGSSTDSHCVDLFTCNLLMGTCPPDIGPGSSVISCR